MSGDSKPQLTSLVAIRLKDIEWVEKKHELLRKALRGATGTANLADKAKKEEFVRQSGTLSICRTL